MKAILFVSFAALLAGCFPEESESPINRNPQSFVTVPGVVECQGAVSSEKLGTYSWTPVLRCNDGRVFHNITNYSFR